MSNGDAAGSQVLLHIRGLLGPGCSPQPLATVLSCDSWSSHIRKVILCSCFVHVVVHPEWSDDSSCAAAQHDWKVESQLFKLLAAGHLLASCKTIIEAVTHLHMHNASFPAYQRTFLYFFYFFYFFLFSFLFFLLFLRKHCSKMLS